MERYTIQTHVDIDSSGKVCGLESKHFVPILIALLASITLFLLISLASNEGALFVKIIIGFAPLFLSIAYVLIFLVGRAPHFQIDFFESIFGGQNFNGVKMHRGKNPLMEVE